MIQNRNVALEAAITRGRAVYISQFLVDSAASVITVLIVSDPENGLVDRRLVFRGTKYLIVDQWSPPETDYLESLIGLDEQQRDRAVEYTITTDRRQVTFQSAVEPEIEQSVAANTA